MKKSHIIYAFGIVALVTTGLYFFTPKVRFGAFSDPFLSIQLATSPQNGYILSTDGTNNSWIANSGGTNYLTNSGSNTYLNTGTFLQAPGLTATSSTATSTIANLNNEFYVPHDFATNGCAGSSSNNTLDLCVEALLDLAVTKGLTGATIWITNDVAQSEWTATMDIDNNGLQVNLFCRPGTRLKYGGSGNAILWNNGDPTGHVKQQISGCTFMGQSSLIAAGNSNSTTTVGIYYGGANGAVGINTHNNTFNGFGTQIEVGANAYMLEWNNNGFSGGNSGQTNRGSLVHINTASNSGERNVFQGNNFTDPADGDADNCIYITSGGTASNFFTNNSIDNCQIYAGASNGQVVISYNHIENPGSPSGFAEYIPIYNPSSDQSTQLTVIGNVFANSASNRTWTTLITHGGQLYAASNNIQNYNGFTITNFADHSNNNGQSADMICHTQVQGGTLTNIVAGGGGTTWSATNGVPCVYNRANSYSWSIRPLSTNVNQFVSGNSVVGDVDHTGNWSLGESVSNSLVTVKKRLYAETSIGAATSTLTYPLESFSSSASQLALSAGAGLPKWAFRNAGGNLYFATTTVAGTATTSTASFSLLNTGEVIVRNLFQIFNVAGTKIMDVAGSAVTLLGTWDFSGATVKVHTYPAFSYSTSTSWTGTTTIPLAPAYTAESWSGVKCFTDTGTLNVSFYDGTNRMDMFNASTTVGNVLFTTNNTFTASEKRYVDIGTPASSPTKISCSVDRIVNN